MKCVLYIAVSRDGYIAGPEDDMTFLDPYNAGGTDFGYEEFYKEVKTIVMGRKTYEWIRSHSESWPYPGRRSIVMTSRLIDDNSDVEVHKGEDLPVPQGSEGGTWWIMGGGEVISKYLAEGLIDEAFIFRIPTDLKAGTKLLSDPDLLERSLKKKGERAHEAEVVEEIHSRK